jgi:hypothetical protein
LIFSLCSHAKNTNPAAELLCSGVRLCAETVEKPYFKRFSGIEKVHRNSIKITVDFWRRRWDLNPCAGYPTYSLSRGAPSPLGYFSMVNIKEKCEKKNVAERKRFELLVPYEITSFQD